MPEGMNIEVAHKLSEQDRADRAKRRWEEIIEILEVLILAVAAIATAWSGYQSARGDGSQSVLYGESMFVRRFIPEYRSAFEAWLKTDPFTDPAAPAGPGYMPEYRSPGLEEAKRLNAQASAAFEAGTATRETADRYVRVTVVFALVLFLVAVGQRFRLPGVRMGAMGLAVGLLVYGLVTAATLPRF
jgi:hypothetical protein